MFSWIRRASVVVLCAVRYSDDTIIAYVNVLESAAWSLSAASDQHAD